MAGDVENGAAPAAGTRGAARAGLARLRQFASPALVDAAAAPLAASMLTLLFVIPTLAPGVLSWDTAEFQAVAPVLGTAHPTGYPGYVILGWLASCILQPFGDPAFRMNLLQAIIAAAAIGATVALIQILTGRRLLALAAGLFLVVMPTVDPSNFVNLPIAGQIMTTPLFWRLSTHADPHMLHVALVAVLFAVLVVWEKRRGSDDPETVRRADRWLVAAAAIYGLAVANHSLALLLPPAIGLYVLAVDWRVILRPRTIAACVGALGVTVVVLFAEIPIRAMMHAPIVYGHPDTIAGFQYVVLAEQFRGSLVDPLGDLGTKAGLIAQLIAGWLGPLAWLGVVGFGTSLVRRPRFLILTGLSLVVSGVFAVSYANADIGRYFLVPVMIVLVWGAIGVADAIAAAAWAVTAVSERLRPAGAAEPAPEPAANEATPAGGRRLTPAPWLVLIGEMVVAVALVFPSIGVIADRQKPTGGLNPGGVSEAQNTYDQTWLNAVLAPADKGGLPANSVIVSWWSTSTTLWYGQKVLGMRPDIYIVDDRTRLDDNLGEVQDVFNKFLGNRPVFTIRLTGGVDGMDALNTEFDIEPYTLGDGSTISQVISRKGSQ